ncbi:MAG: hypothetical protein WCJ80_06150 [Bacteroidota bacterium]
MRKTIAFVLFKPHSYLSYHHDILGKSSAACYFCRIAGGFVYCSACISCKGYQPMRNNRTNKRLEEPSHRSQRSLVQTH